ncbi:synaptojanin-2-binding protein isoform X2 [Diceros bicornis minor]|uniref:synaptojanin-2-binding protein isoform X2 n=1 Tax=Diceros bicornis minor TaxID=77932 RepID=UPI0026ECB17C|nr:synaptojanin-2-binding protein isoform X2 [Diceros bicornis minor]
MNGRVDYLVTEEEINLTRGPSDLYSKNHYSGKWKITDEICGCIEYVLNRVNGQDLKNLLHQDAVALFRNAGYAVSLRVQHRLQVPNGPIGHRGEREPSGIPIAMVLAPVFAFTMVAAWAFMRYRRHL